MPNLGFLIQRLAFQLGVPLLREPLDSEMPPKIRELYNQAFVKQLHKELENAGGLVVESPKKEPEDVGKEEYLMGPYDA